MMTDSLNFDENIKEEENKTELTEAEKNAKWYVVHTYTGYENRVSDKIQMMIDNEQNPDIIDVTVPTEEYVEVKNNDKKVKTRKLFPGYVMVKMNVTNKSWYIIRNTQGVTGFVGPESKPVAVSEKEIQKFALKNQSYSKKEIDVNVGDNVNIVSGAFSDQVGIIEEINTEKAICKVLISLFGRDTSVAVSYTHLTLPTSDLV